MSPRRAKQAAASACRPCEPRVPIALRGARRPSGSLSARGRLDLTLNSHGGGRVHLDIAEGGAHQRDVGRRPVGDRHPDVAPGGASTADGHAHSAAGQARRPGRRPANGIRRRIDGRLPDPLARGVDDKYLVTDEEAHLHNSEQEKGDERQGEGQLDGGLALATPSVVGHFTLPVRLFMIESSNFPTRSVWVAQPTTSRATAAAPSSTRAYSAVA